MLVNQMVISVRLSVCGEVADNKWTAVETAEQTFWLIKRNSTNG